MQLADATKEKGVVMTSSPALTPAAIIAQCSPAVPEETPTPCRRPASLAHACSNWSSRGPIESVGGVQHVHDCVNFTLGDIRLGKRNFHALSIVGHRRLMRNSDGFNLSERG